MLPILVYSYSVQAWLGRIQYKIKKRSLSFYLREITTLYFPHDKKNITNILKLLKCKQLYFNLYPIYNFLKKNFRTAASLCKAVIRSTIWWIWSYNPNNKCDSQIGYKTSYTHLSSE